MVVLLDEQLPTTATVVAAVRETGQNGGPVSDPTTTPPRRGGGGVLDGLTPREMDVLAQIAHGLSNRAVADGLEISAKAVEKYVTAIFSKLGLVDDRQLNRRVVAALIFLHDRPAPPAGPPAGDGA